MSIFLSGFASIDITPPEGCELTGYAVPDRLATGVHDPLKAYAVVFDDRRQKSIFCAVDVCVIHEDVARVVRKRVSGRTAIPEHRIVIAATHTHSGPKLMNSDLLINQRWVRELEDRLTQVMMLADYHRVPATIATATREAPGVGGNRRSKDGPVDAAVSVLRVDGVREGRPIGAVVNVACHPTVLGPDNRLYSADYIGQLREAMQATLGDDVPVVCFNGACGDVNPGGYSAEASLRGETVPGRTFERAAEIGQIMGKAAADAFAHATAQAELRIEADSSTFDVKLRPFPLPAEAREAYDAAVQRSRAAPRGSEAHKQAMAEVTYAQCQMANAKRYAECPDGKMNVMVQAFSIADWSLVTFPTEVFASHGLAIKQNSPFAQTMIAAYANQSLGYLPDYTDDDADSYEQRVALFGPWAVDTIVGMAELLLKQLHKRQQQSTVPASPTDEVEVKPELVLEHTAADHTCVPAIDFHLHWWTYWHSFEEVLERMDKANIQYGVTLVGDVFPQCDLRPVLKLMEPVKDRFFYFTSVDFKRIDDDDWPSYVREKLRQDVELGARGIKLYKDLGLSYVDSTGRLLRAMDSRVRVLWDAAAELNLPVLYHVADPPAFFEPTIEPWNERYAPLRSRPSWWWGRPGYPSYDSLIDEMYELTAAHRDTTFVFPHCASLSNDLRRCSDLISSGDNIYVDLSARLPQLARQPYRAHEFCVKHADRVLFGTDDSLPGRNDVYQLWIRVLETKDEYFTADYYGARQPWRFYGMGLPKDVLSKIYRENAMRLLKLES
ncbi:neutral/alkaline non-lysosomal ceramidase N-terminal domain-containing protein [Phycisphaerales bacterium AB-hyl4]|uniref:Neutral/alkaline non-lysosomal ceramidase N-terminal domain-containing protein n=1 Tax=Natronomicrosphaera hydrolytica TaxID=3242702 RepID=A0ABV4U545_9BACT